MTGLYLRLRKLTTKYLKMGAVTVNELSTDGTMVGNSDQALPTEKAVKTYVDTKVLGGSELKDDPAPELAADLDVKGFAIKDTTGVPININGNTNVNGIVKANSVTVKGLMSTAIAEKEVDISGATGLLEFTEIPVGAWIIGYTMINTVAVETDEDDTYTGEITGTGGAIKLNGDKAIAGALNTKSAIMTGMGIVASPVIVTLTPGGSGTEFTAGKIKMGIVFMTTEEYPDVE